MFGERRNSILPIIYDIANIVKKNMIEKTDDNAFTTVEKSNKEFQSDDELHRSKRSTKFEDDRPSYHERKLNMTNFRGTSDSNDQHAIESETRVHVSLPNSNITSSISLEEIENLAFKDLNGSAFITYDNDTNGSNIESLPEPEMLIRPYRVRPRPISERFDNLYLYVIDYPM